MDQAQNLFGGLMLADFSPIFWVWIRVDLYTSEGETYFVTHYKAVTRASWVGVQQGLNLN